MTLYLLDANVLIRAHGDYYPLDRITRFWIWLLEKGAAGVVKVPRQIYREVDRSSDVLGQWMSQPEVRSVLMLAEAADMRAVQQVISAGYAPDLTDIELLEVGKDPFIIAAAMKDPHTRVVVSRERSRPSLKRGRRKVPDVCATLGVRCIDDFQLWRELDFQIP